METVYHNGCVTYHDVTGEERIKCGGDTVYGYCAIGFKSCHIVTCVYAGIGSSAPYNINRFFGYFSCGVLQSALNCGKIFLNLPSVITTSVVGEDKAYVIHGKITPNVQV